MSVKITELPILDSLADNDIVAGVDSSANVTSKIELGTLKNYIDTNTQYTAGTNIDITNNVVSAPDVYNKTETDEQIEKLQNELDAVSTIYNAFPTASDEDESMILDDTAETKFKKLDLKGNTSQETTTGINLFCPDAPSKTQNGITVTNNGDETFTINGTATANVSIPLTITSIGQPLTGEQPYTMAIDIISNGGSEGSLTTEILKNGTIQYNFYAISPAQTTGMKVQVSTPSEDAIIRGIAYYVGSGGVVNNLKIRPYLVKGSYTASNVPAYEPYTGGIASPNPDYPQDIHVVSGDNEIKVVGKNLASDIFSDYSVITGAYRSMPIKLEQGQTYILKANRIGELKTSYYNYGLAKDGYSFSTFVDPVYAINYNSGATETVTLTIDSSYTNPVLFCYTSNEEIFDELFTNYEIQLEVGSTATTYEPYVSSSYQVNLPIENILDITSSGSSIGGVPFTIENGIIKINGTTSSSTASYYFNTFRTKSESAMFSIEVTGYTDKSSGNSALILQQSDDGTTGWSTLSELSLNSVYAKQNSVTLDSSKYYRLRWYVNNNTFTNAKIKAQLEYGNKKNSFTSYGTTPIELCKIGTYQDYIYKDNGKWYLHKEIGKYVITSFASKGGGNANILYYTSNITDILKPALANNLINTMSNSFTAKTAQQIYASNLIGVGVNTNGSLSCGFGASSSLTTLELANTWVASNNINVYYPLATPTNTEITYEPLIDQLNLLEQAQSKENQTNISQVNNDLPFIISAEAILSLQNVLDRIELLES